MHPLKKLIFYTIGGIVIWLAYEIWQSFKMNDEFYRCVATVAQNSSNHDPGKPILGFVYSGEDGLNLCMESKGYKIRDDPDPHCAKSLIPMCFERH